MMATLTHAEPTHAELVARLGNDPSSRLAAERARVLETWHEMRAKTDRWQHSVHDCQLLDGWQERACERMFGMDELGQLREVLRFERQLAAVRDGSYAEQQAELQRQRLHAATARARLEAPARLLAVLRAQGKHLALDSKGRIVAPPDAGLDAAEVEAVKEHRAELVALLRAEAVAARPLVIA